MARLGLEKGGREVVHRVRPFFGLGLGWLLLIFIVMAVLLVFVFPTPTITQLTHAAHP